MLMNLFMLWIILVLNASTSHSIVTIHSLYSLKEQHAHPNDWIRGERAPREYQLSLHIGLAQENFKELEKKLDEISTPGHPRFRHHLSAQDVLTFVQPSNNTIDSVKAWLENNGVPIEFSPNRDWIITPKLPLPLVEQLLQTSYHIYRKQKLELVRTENWSLPLHLHSFIDIIQPTTSFSQMKPLAISSQSRRKSNQSSTQPSLNDAAEDIPNGIDILPGIDLSNPPSDLTAEMACNTSAVTPICLRTLYGTLNYKTQVPEKNSMALTNYWGEFNNRSDINQYLHLYRPDATEAANEFANYNIDGAINQQTPASAQQLESGQGREGNLDAQVMLAIGSPTRLVTYSVGGEPPPYEPDASLPDNTNEPFLTWLQYVLAQPELPTVISTSYADTEYTVPPSYARRVCNSFAQLGARGVTVIFGSGDWGVGDSKQCHSPDGKPRFVARFPESCPYGTSVGATRNINPEIVAYNDRNGFVSGGGFSEYFARPGYQDHAVGSYISRLDGLHDGLYNPHGRGYPDVAAMGYRIVTVWNGTTKVVDGTSASAPIFAAVVALVNDALIAESKPPLGFLNPWLYMGGFKAFTDVTLGSARGCNASGFPAMSGWDPASGFGTPVSFVLSVAEV